MHIHILLPSHSNHPNKRNLAKFLPVMNRISSMPAALVTTSTHTRTPRRSSAHRVKPSTVFSLAWYRPDELKMQARMRCIRGRVPVAFMASQHVAQRSAFHAGTMLFAPGPSACHEHSSSRTRRRVCLSFGHKRYADKASRSVKTRLRGCIEVAASRYVRRHAKSNDSPGAEDDDFCCCDVGRLLLLLSCSWSRRVKCVRRLTESHDFSTCCGASLKCS
jgi:hypothetical protein